MILLVRRRTITILVFSALAFSLGMGVLTYLTIQTFRELSAAEQKIVAEQVLLVAIVGTIVVCAGLLLVVHEAVNLSRVFKRLAGMHRMSGDQIHSELRALGVVGEQIGNLYTSINSLSARKSTRIAAMDSLLSTVLSRTDENMLIVNAAGKVYRATSTALEHLEASRADVVDHSIDDFVEAEPFSETAAAVARRKGSHVIGEGREAIVVLPVTNDQGLIAYYVYLLGADARDELKRNPRERPTPQARQRKQSNGAAKDRDSSRPAKNDRSEAADADSGRTSEGGVADGGDTARDASRGPVRALLRRFTKKRT